MFRRRESFRQSFLEYLFEFVQVLVISAAIILPIRFFLIQPFYVKGASMEPTLLDHEYLIIDEISYRLRAPERGETIVFRHLAVPREYYIKRIIGLPGERVVIKNNQIKIFNVEHHDGLVLQEPYLPKDLTTDGEIDLTLDATHYFVMGDNREHSFDSRRFGPIEKDTIVGRAWVRGWPFDRATIFPLPSY